MTGILINQTAQVITPKKFQKRCEALLKQKFVRFTEEEKKQIDEISKIPDVPKGFEQLTEFLNNKYENIKNRTYELFQVGKKTYDGRHTNGILARLNTNRKKLLIKPERAADIYDKVTTHQERVLKFFTNLIYKNPSNADVLRIEQNLRKQGVKAKFSDKSSGDFARLTEETMRDISKQGYDIPKRLCVSPFIGMCTKGSVLMGPTKPAETVFFNTSFAEQPLKYFENYMLGKFLKRIFSTDNPKHTIRHEIGHYLHSRKGLRDLYLQYLSSSAFLPNSKPILSENNKELIKKSVSEYATEGERGTEAVAEIFAGLIDGKKYGRRITDIYHRLKGPVPKTSP